MKIEIELHEAQSEDGESVRIRIIREIRDATHPEAASVTLVRDHDSGLELRLGTDGSAFEDGEGRCYRLVRRLA